MKKLIAAAVLTLALAGCATQAPVLNITDAPINTNIQQQDVGQVIERGLRTRGWQVAARRPDAIDAYVIIRQHRADITVSYDQDSYSIAYRDSEGLEYRNGRIHRNYNRWVANLNTDIQRAMADTP